MIEVKKGIGKTGTGLCFLDGNQASLAPLPALIFDSSEKKKTCNKKQLWTTNICHYPVAQ